MWREAAAAPGFLFTHRRVPAAYEMGDKMIAGTVVRGSGRSCRLPRLMALSLSRRPPGNRTRDDDSRSAILERQTGSYSRCRLVPQ